VLLAKLLERRRREATEAADRTTIAVANGFAIATNPDAARAWNREHAGGAAPQTREGFLATLGRVGALPGVGQQIVKVH
jgi:uncharacterized protein YyaL (SSP411 family)